MTTTTFDPGLAARTRVRMRIGKVAVAACFACTLPSRCIDADTFNAPAGRGSESVMS